MLHARRGRRPHEAVYRTFLGDSRECPTSLAVRRIVICPGSTPQTRRLPDRRCALAIEANSYRKHFVAPASFVLLAKSYCVT
jgi:hypothetical protein